MTLKHQLQVGTQDHSGFSLNPPINLGFFPRALSIATP